MPSLGEFAQFFLGLFGAWVSSAEPASLVLTLGLAEVPAFTSAEVKDALARMAPHKSAGLAHFSVDLFCACHDSLYSLLAALFSCFARAGYPHLLSTLLLLPLYQQQGEHDSYNSFRGVSLIHPIGRWFSKCFDIRLRDDPASGCAHG